MTHEQFEKAQAIQGELEDLYKSKNQLGNVERITSIKVELVNRHDEYSADLPDWLEEKLFPELLERVVGEVNARINILEEEFKSL